MAEANAIRTSQETNDTTTAPAALLVAGTETDGLGRAYTVIRPATQNLWISGTDAVLSTTGMLIAPGEAFTVVGSAPVYGVSAASQTVYIMRGIQ